MRPLPAPPTVGLSLTRDQGEGGRALGGFLDVRRLEFTARFPDGTVSAAFPYDVGARKALDAVVMAATYFEDGVRWVYLRSAVRPACAVRPLPPSHDGCMWELPAGLVEPGEEPAVTAVRELGEELGFTVQASAMKPLGEWTFPSPGMIGERHIHFVVDVDPKTRTRPTEDGSALERGASILALPVSEAVEHCRRGAIRDAKTELALRRLLEVTS